MRRGRAGVSGRTGVCGGGDPSAGFSRSAASVLAKTHRDEYMMRLAEEFPQYGWMKNKGYPTREHRLAIREYGLTPHHRLTFNHEIDQLEFPF